MKRKNPVLWSLILLIVSIFPRPGFAENFVLRKNQQHALDAPVEIFIDASRQLDVRKILEMDTQGAFKRAAPSDLAQGFSNAAFWIKTGLENQSTAEVWTLSSAYAFEKLEGFQVRNGHIERLEDFPDARLPAVGIRLERGENALIYIRVTSRQLVELQLFVQSRQEFLKKDKEDSIFFGIILGCFLSMILYNFFLCVSLRDRNYLYYLFFATVNVHLNLIAVKFPTGILRLWGVDWDNWIEVYRPLAPLTTFLFVRAFLQTKKDYPLMEKIFLVYMAGLLALIPAAFWVEKATMSGLENAYFLLGILILFAAGINSFRKGFQPSNYYLAGLAAFMLGLIAYLAHVAGYLPTNILTLNSAMIGQAAEMLLMSLALSGRIKMLQIERARANITAEVKSRLLRVISHDIANPLAIVKAVTYILLKNKLVTDRMVQIKRSVEMIEDIMRFVIKTESLGQGQKFPLENVSIPSVFESLEFLFKDRAAQKGLELKFEALDNNLTVRAEKTSLTSEVLGNLISNAIKFSHSGSTVQIQAFREKERVVIRIRDFGIGMPKGTVATLFHSQKNQSRNGTGGEKGMGYGMPLTKAFVDAYGADISVESRSIEENPDDCGTTYRVSLQSVSEVL